MVAMRLSVVENVSCKLHFVYMIFRHLFPSNHLSRLLIILQIRYLYAYIQIYIHISRIYAPFFGGGGEAEQDSLELFVLH